MDRHQFDELVKAMARGTSRRDVLRGLLGGVAAGAAVIALPEIALAESHDDDDEDSDDDDDNGGGNGIGTLPTTGSGVSNDPNPWMGALAAGGIVAAAATVLRRNKAETEQRHIS